MTSTPRSRRLRAVAVAGAAILLLGAPVTTAATAAQVAAAPGSDNPWPGMHGWMNGSNPEGNSAWGPGGMMNGPMMSGPMMGGGMMVGRWGTADTCQAPAATGQHVRFIARDMSGGMMMRGTMMRLMPMWARTSAGTITIDLLNVGSRPHELLVYRLADGQVAGQRVVGANDRISEEGSLGEVEPVCQQPASVDGIAAGNTGRVTLTLTPGRYEIVCNLPGHYRNGMYATLVVT